MKITRQVLFESPLLRVGGICVRPDSATVTEASAATVNVIALPVAGLFATHESARHSSVVSPSHAAVLPAHRPYALSFPGGIGDDCLTLQFESKALSEVLPESLGSEGLDAVRHASCTLLPPAALVARALLRQQLWPNGKAGLNADPLEMEERCLWLLNEVLASARKGGEKRPRTRPSSARQRVERVKEALALETREKWSLGELARVANMSAFHLSHAFRAHTGTSVYQYALKMRLGHALDRLMAGEEDITALALDTGFASHSHFTSRFRTHFGFTPSSARQFRSA